MKIKTFAVTLLAACILPAAASAQDTEKAVAAIKRAKHTQHQIEALGPTSTRVKAFQSQVKQAKRAVAAAKRELAAKNEEIDHEVMKLLSMIPDPVVRQQRIDEYLQAVNKEQ